MEKIIYSKSFVEFLKNSDCKIAQILYRLHNKHYESLILTSAEINYLTFRNDGTISYLPAGKELKYNDDGQWAREGRQNGKPAKVIRKLFSDRVKKLFKDADFECFTNAYKANFNEDGYCFELLPNKQIPSVYEMERAIGEGSLNNSCMNGDSEYLEIYANCDKLQILILKDKNGLLCGRSLVWKLTDDITLMDRIYVTQDFMYDKFLNYAKGNYWTKKDYKSYDNKRTFINLLGEEIDKTFTVHTNTDFDNYPYIDTFQYGDDGSLNNNDGEYTYNNTDGTRNGGEDDHSGEVYDDINGEYISEDDAIYIENGERCYRDRYCHVDNCVNVNDRWYYEDDSNIVCVHGEWYTKDSEDLCKVNDEFELLDDCVYSEMDSCYYLNDDCVHVEEIDDYILETESVQIDGDYFHQDSENIIKIDGEYYKKDSEDICEIDGNYYLTTSDKVELINDEYVLINLETI